MPNLVNAGAAHVIKREALIGGERGLDPDAVHPHDARALLTIRTSLLACMDGFDKARITPGEAGWASYDLAPTTREQLARLISLP